jgi:hypothetical protein
VSAAKRIEPPAGPQYPVTFPAWLMAVPVQDGRLGNEPRSWIMYWGVCAYTQIGTRKKKTLQLCMVDIVTLFGAG